MANDVRLEWQVKLESLERKNKLLEEGLHQAERLRHIYDHAVRELKASKRLLMHQREAIAASERLANTILEQATEAMVICDEQGRIIRASRVAQKLVDGDRIGQKFDEAFSLRLDDGSPLIIPPLGRDETFSGEAHFTRQDQPAQQWLINAGPLLDTHENKLGCIVTLTNITEHKRAEETMRRLNEELEAKVNERTQQLLEARDELVQTEKLAVLGRVADSVGHELRNPLGIMSNAVYFLKTVLSDSDETVFEYLDIIRSEIANADRIVSDLLNAVRTKPPYPRSSVVDDLIEQTLAQCHIPRQIHVLKDVPATLPPVRVDADQMQQVFRNLVTNAVEAMPEGGELEFCAFEDRMSGTVSIAIRDTGIGIPQEDRDRLFHPLFTTKLRAIGLGLVVVKNLTEANGGRVEVESEPGKGTTFTVELPVDQ